MERWVLKGGVRECEVGESRGAKKYSAGAGGPKPPSSAYQLKSSESQ